MAEQQFAAAERFYRQAIELDASQAIHHLSLGVALFEQDRQQEAQAPLAEARRLDPAGGEADFFLGRISARTGDSETAAGYFRVAVTSVARFERALAALIDLVMNTGNPALAATTFDELVARDPSWATAHYGVGILAMISSNSTAALQAFQRAIALDPKVVQFRITLADVLLFLGRAEEGLEAADRLILVAPLLASGHLQRGRALELLGRWNDCAAALTRALEFDGTLVLAQYALARALGRLGRHEEAITAYQNTLTLVPAYQDAHYLMAVEQLALGRAVEATSSLRDAAREQPDRFEIWGHLAHGAWADLDWRDRTTIEAELTSRIARDQRACSPFDFLLVSDSARLQQQSASCSAIAAQPALVRHGYAQHRKLRIAYLSPDFRHHAVSFLMAGVFEAHDRENFEIVGLGWGANDDSAIGQRVRRAFDQFIDISELGDEQAARLLQEMEIDIAVDLAGRTHRARPGIFCWHGAAIQINYLGFPATLGASYMDYILADRYVIPENCQQFYTERVALLPECFQSNDTRRLEPRRDVTRNSSGLPDDAFVFCCLNSTAKVSPLMFDVWMRLLLATDNSVLWILCTSSATKANLLEEAKKRGVSADRLVLAGDVDYEHHVARQSLADLGLDTFPFNGGTSVSDSLWAGLPVVSYSGEAFASRMAGSILLSLGLDDLVTHSLADYERVALRLAHEPDQLALLRQRLVTNRTSSSLFSSERFCVNLEKIYRDMWQQSLADAPGPKVVPAC